MNELTPQDGSYAELERLAQLVAQRNAVESEIGAILGRQAALRDLAEFVAARVFPIHLIKDAAHTSIDGFFNAGPLVGCSVNVRWYALRDGVLDLTPGFLPDYFLVFVGPPPSPTGGLRLRARPWRLNSLHLFDAAELVDDLELRGVRVGAGSSVRKELWEGAEIYPEPVERRYPLDETQRALLALFR